MNYNKKCIYDGCETRATQNFKGMKPLYCSKHKLGNMINVVDKKCQHEGCFKIPYFNYINNLKCIYCEEHKLENMINVKSRSNKCIYAGCEKRASYGNKEDCKIQYCLKHKNNDMIDLIHSLCSTPNCKNRPTWGVIGSKKPEKCSKHRAENMVIISLKICAEEECNKRAEFGFKKTSATYCSEHKKENMLCLKNKICDFEDCKTQAYWGFIGKSPNKCTFHREIGMIKRPNSKCLHCKEKALFGNLSTVLRCDKHKTEDDINLGEHECIKCKLHMILNKDNICEYCEPKSFERARLHKQKELMNFLDSYNLYGNQTDKTINNGICGMERPDRVFELPDKIIILECDEEQHKNRNCVCEHNRMINIGQSYGGTPVYFVRFNPDNYKPLDGCKEDTIIKRYKLCKKFIESIINNKMKYPTGNLVYAFYLYYDDWNGIENEKWEIIT